MKKFSTALITRQDVLYGNKMKQAEGLKVVEEHDIEDEAINAHKKKKTMMLLSESRDSIGRGSLI